MSHTPGPWKAHFNPDVNEWEVTSDETPFVAHVVWTAHVPDDTAANSHLIAAAPDLLEAAEEYMRTVHMGHTQFAETGEDFNPLCAMFRAAIAKAEGRETP